MKLRFRINPSNPTGCTLEHQDITLNHLIEHLQDTYSDSIHTILTTRHKDHCPTCTCT